MKMTLLILTKKEEVQYEEKLCLTNSAQSRPIKSKALNQDQELNDTIAMLMVLSTNAYDSIYVHHVTRRAILLIL